MTNVRPALTVIGEEIAGEWNAAALADAAQWFGGRYIDLHASSDASRGVVASDGREQVSLPDPLREYDWLIAAENIPNAADIYTYRLPPGVVRPALILGNESKGLRRRTHKRADATVQIPIISQNINCLNVAAAAAVMLAYLSQSPPLPYVRRTLSAVQRSRPGLLLIGGADHRELGSAIRSATAFGWDTVLLLDRYDAWYSADRAVRSESRGMARRGRNPIRVVPFAEDMVAAYRRIVVVTREAHRSSLFHLPLMGGDTLLVLPDEREQPEDWRMSPRARTEIIYASLPPIPAHLYHFRQTASIALAEAARQLGRPDSDGIYLRSRRDRYRRQAAGREELLIATNTRRQHEMDVPLSCFGCPILESESRDFSEVTHISSEESGVAD
jgi:tRNA G18 (ribose-2'-O)-methylase SpoU